MTENISPNIKKRKIYEENHKHESCCKRCTKSIMNCLEKCWGYILKCCQCLNCNDCMTYLQYLKCPCPKCFQFSLCKYNCRGKCSLCFDNDVYSPTKIFPVNNKEKVRKVIEQNKIEIKADIRSMLLYSPKKNIANVIAEYSIKKPATNHLPNK